MYINQIYDYSYKSGNYSVTTVHMYVAANLMICTYMWVLQW